MVSARYAVTEREPWAFMKREEIAAVQKLELEEVAEAEIAEMRREARAARERIELAAAALAAKLGLAPPVVEPVVPVLPEPAPVVELPVEPPALPEPVVAEAHRETANFADIAANIAGNDWKDL